MSRIKFWQFIGVFRDIYNVLLPRRELFKLPRKALSKHLVVNRSEYLEAETRHYTLAKRATTGIAPVSPGILQGILLFELRCWGSEPNRTAIFRVERRTLYH